MPPTPPLRPPVARFLATSSAWLMRDHADLRGISGRSRPDDDCRLDERSRPGHSEPMGERELIAHRRRLRALWIAQWEASLQAKLGVAQRHVAATSHPAELLSQTAADHPKQLATQTD